VTTEERPRFEVLPENLDVGIRVVADGHLALDERLDRMGTRLERRCDQLEISVTVLGTRVTALDAKVGALAPDTRRRLERIETHLGLNEPPGASEAAAQCPDAAQGELNRRSGWRASKLDELLQLERVGRPHQQEKP